MTPSHARRPRRKLKLKLEIGELAVETFSPVPGDGTLGGTAFGHVEADAGGADAIGTGYSACFTRCLTRCDSCTDCPTCEVNCTRACTLLTCARTCDPYKDTCYLTCPTRAEAEAGVG